jgi:hypothetical protein
VDWGTAIALISALGVVVGYILVFVRGSGDSKLKADELRQKETQDQFTANIALNTYIDGKISAALAPSEKRVTDLEAQVKKLTEREATTKNILRRYFQRLLWWDEIGRPDEMPMPSPEDMRILDLSDIDSGTSPAAEIAELRTNLPKE